MPLPEAFVWQIWHYAARWVFPARSAHRNRGVYDVSFSHSNKDLSLKPEAERRLRFQREFGCYVMENILFKIAFPAEFHAQTACEAAVLLHAQVKERLADIERVVVTTHDSAIRIISKTGALANPADRDHCLQYMTAVPLIFGSLTAEHYETAFMRLTAN